MNDEYTVGRSTNYRLEAHKGIESRSPSILRILRETVREYYEKQEKRGSTINSAFSIIIAGNVCERENTDKLGNV